MRSAAVSVASSGGGDGLLERGGDLRRLGPVGMGAAGRRYRPAIAPAQNSGPGDGRGVIQDEPGDPVRARQGVPLGDEAAVRVTEHVHPRLAEVLDDGAEEAYIRVEPVVAAVGELPRRASAHGLEVDHCEMQSRALGARR